MHAILLAGLAAIGWADQSSRWSQSTHRSIDGSVSYHPMRDRYHGGGERHDNHYHPRYNQVPVVRDCVGDMRAEPNKCVCRKQYGFFKQTCSAGQQCFRGDGTCLDFQEVTCMYGGSDVTSWLSAYYQGTPIATFQNDDAGRDDAEPGRLVMYSGPDDQTTPVLARLNTRDEQVATDRTSFSFSFMDMGPDFDLVFAAMDNPDTRSCDMEDILDAMVCTTSSGPWTSGATLSTQNGAVDISANIGLRRRRLAKWAGGCKVYNADTDSCEGDCHKMPADVEGRYTDIEGSSADGPWCMSNDIGMRSTDYDLFMALRANKKRGRWTDDPKPDCSGNAGWDRAVSYSPYRMNNAVTCNVVEEMGLGELGCGAIRNAGVDCCYDNDANTCGFNRRCKYDGGLFVLLNDDWETETFGTPEKNHLHDLADGLIAGRARVPDGSTYVAMTHSHGDDAPDAPEPATDDGKVDGNDGAADDMPCSPGECL